MASGPYRVEPSDLATGAVDEIGNVEGRIDRVVKLDAIDSRADEYKGVAGSVVLRQDAAEHDWNSNQSYVLALCIETAS